MTPLADRNIEIVARHNAGEPFAHLARAYGISRARAHRVVARAVMHSALGLPPTLPTGNGAWRVARARAMGGRA